MSKTARYRLNALILGLVAAHAVYWFAMGRAESATTVMVGLRVAQAIVGFAGVVWFLGRSRGASQ